MPHPLPLPTRHLRLREAREWQRSFSLGILRLGPCGPAQDEGSYINPFKNIFTANALFLSRAEGASRRTLRTRIEASHALGRRIPEPPFRARRRELRRPAGEAAACIR